MSIVILGIDLGKNSCSLVGLDESGSVVLRRRMRRDGVIALASKLAPCTMAMEVRIPEHPVACSSDIRSVIPRYPVTSR